MSFVDLMANDFWSEADIVRRTEALIRSEFSQEAETILNRKVLGMTLGTYQASDAEQAELLRYSEVAQSAQAEGLVARGDMDLLGQVFILEQAQRRLNRPAVVIVEEPEPVEPDPVDPELVDLDLEPVDPDLELTETELTETETPVPILPWIPSPTLADVQIDLQERADAEQVLATASAEALNLFTLRNPPPPVIEEELGPETETQTETPELEEVIPDPVEDPV